MARQNGRSRICAHFSALTSEKLPFRERHLTTENSSLMERLIWFDFAREKERMAEKS
jgi:hypothetical protein